MEVYQVKTTKMIATPNKVKNRVGEIYGRYKVIEYVGMKGDLSLWKIACLGCGSERIMDSDRLAQSRRRNSGCRRCGSIITHMKNTIDLTGRRCGRLVALEFSHIGEKNKKRYWKCKCDCGNITYVISSNFNKGRIRSCGCIVNENMRLLGRRTPCNKLPENEIGYSTLYSTYIHGARERGYEFQLNKDEFYILVKSNCFYCDQEPEERSYVSNGKEIRYNTNGLDRVDNSIGYVINNVVTCCSKCNKMKLNHSINTFLNQITKIYMYQNSKLNGN